MRISDWSSDVFSSDLAARTPQDEALDIPPHEMERIVHDMLTREYTKTLDEPVPALSHKTPRVLACTKAGRVKVADWLKYIENGAAKTGTADPKGTYDFTWMWEELGLCDQIGRGSVWGKVVHYVWIVVGAVVLKKKKK